MKKVGVIGGSGYINSDIIDLLLHKQFEVKVSTEDLSNKENYQHLMDLDHSEHLHVCEVNSKQKSDLTDFTSDCDFVIFFDSRDLNL